MPLPRGLRKHCESVLARLPIPNPFSVEAFANALAEQRGRPIKIDSISIPPGPDVPTGLWIALPSVDVIFVQVNTSPAHAALITLHELGHIAAGHQCRVDPDVLTMVFPDLTPELIHSSLLTRAGYDDRQEQEAEVLALLLAEHLGTRNGTTRRAQRLTTSLVHPVRARLFGRAA